MIAGWILAAALAGPPEALVHIDEAAAYETLLTKMARDADAEFAGSACPGASVEHYERQPIKIGDRPDLAAMHERLKLTGCGRDTIQNINVVRFGGAPPWRMVFGVPGESNADMMLQMSAMPAAVANARAGMPAECQRLQLGNVYVAARPGHVDVTPPGAKAIASRPGHFGIGFPPKVEAQRDRFELTRAWTEVWPFTSCGKNRTLAVVFLPLKGQAASMYLFIPVWQIEAQNPGARPAPAPKE